MCAASGADLVNPVGVHHTKASTLAAHALLSHAAQVAGGLELGHSLVGGLTAHHTLHRESVRYGGGRVREKREARACNRFINA